MPICPRLSREPLASSLVIVRVVLVCHATYDSHVKLSGLRKAGLPPDFLIRSSPVPMNISETPKSHNLTVVRSADTSTFSGLTWHVSSDPISSA